ncbi:hypothetical protein HG537_0E00330 [Torulaspora globosa]|uniref:Palmitoyltransferase n=1 Tax=Torulaspora globosa TaxID=48254 RepID=A0A7H9HTJ5_9SACH|nr:hypothetical protein HG537_0E00330 [Torulaspora sp. CBS 2947]
MCLTGRWSVFTVFPRALVVVLYCWTAFVTCTRVDQVPLGVVWLVVAFMLGIGWYAYYKLITVDPGSPLDYAELAVGDIVSAENGAELPPEFLSRRSVTSKRDGRFRLCRTCHVWKPDRTHHCSRCDRCILKMDHHCPWIPGCVGFRNQRYFIQFLIYSTAYAFTILAITSAQLYMWFQDGAFERELIDLSLLSVWLLAFAMSIAMLCFTAFSIHLVTKNQTTIELYTQRSLREELEVLAETGFPRNYAADNVFDLGSPSSNWSDVMGETLAEWLLPIRTTRSLENKHTLDDKGLYFTFRSEMNDRLLDTLDLQDRLLRRVTPRSSAEHGFGSRV